MSARAAPPSAAPGAFSSPHPVAWPQCGAVRQVIVPSSYLYRQGFRAYFPELQSREEKYPQARGKDPSRRETLPRPSRRAGGEKTGRPSLARQGEKRKEPPPQFPLSPLAGRGRVRGPAAGPAGVARQPSALAAPGLPATPCPSSRSRLRRAPSRPVPRIRARRRGGRGGGRAGRSSCRVRCGRARCRRSSR